MAVKEALESLEILLKEVRPLLLIAKIPKHQLRIRNQNHQVASLARAFDWLHNLKMSPEYDRLKWVRGLLPEETWRKYDLHQLEGLQEQILLRIAIKDLQNKWRKKRPAVFNRDVKKVSDTGKESRIKRR